MGSRWLRDEDIGAGFCNTARVIREEVNVVVPVIECEG